MKTFITLLILACSGVFSAATFAQNTPSRTYFGWDGPPQFGGNTYIAHTYGNTIEIMPRGDACSRQFFIQGVMSISPNLNRGSIAGAMKRCTTRKLVVNCGHATDYEISFDGTVLRDETHRRLYLNLNYTMEIWNEDSCEKERDEQQSEIVQLLYQPPHRPAPTTTQTLGGIADDSKKIALDSFWTMGGLSPR